MAGLTAALIATTVIGAGSTLIASGNATGAAKDNAAAATQTAQINADLIRDTQAANAGLATDQKVDNAGVIGANQQANEGILTAGGEQAAGAINQSTGQAVGAIQDGSEGAMGAVLGYGAQAQSSIANQQRSNAALFQPYTEVGKKATDAITALLGLGGDVEAQNAAFENWRNSTGYQFQLESGSDAVASNKATKGLLRSGSALKDLTKFGQDLGSTTFGTYFDRLGGQQQVGLSATSNLASLNSQLGGQSANQFANTGSSLANIYGARGAAMAGIYGNSGSALAGIYQNTAGNRAANNTNSANALVNSNSSVTSALIGGNNNASNALVGNNNNLQSSVAGYNTQAANTSANALMAGASNLTSTLGYIYGGQGAAAGGGGSALGIGSYNAYPQIASSYRLPSVPQI